MGFLSKKTVKCTHCGKDFETRIAVLFQLCPECSEKKRNLQEDVKGYIDYACEMKLPEYSMEQMSQIVAHREQILEKYRQIGGISKEELKRASDNYRKLTDEQAMDILTRMSRATLLTTTGAGYSDKFFAPTSFEKLIVDAEDVYAVGYTTGMGLSALGTEAILCGVFTNDPYIPVFPMVFLGKIGFLEFKGSKKGRQGVESLFTAMCPNLTYPVQELKQLKKQLKAEGTVKGNMDLQYMLDRINDVEYQNSFFKGKQLAETYLNYRTAEMLESFGYFVDKDINFILKIDKMLNRKYWEKQFARLADYNNRA